MDLKLYFETLLSRYKTSLCLLPSIACITPFFHSFLCLLKSSQEVWAFLVHFIWYNTCSWSWICSSFSIRIKYCLPWLFFKVTSYFRLRGLPYCRLTPDCNIPVSHETKLLCVCVLTSPYLYSVSSKVLARFTTCAFNCYFLYCKRELHHLSPCPWTCSSRNRWYPKQVFLGVTSRK